MIVISGANIEKGGPLTIYNTFIQSFSKKYPNEKIIAFVSNKVEFPFFDNVTYKKISFYKSFLVNKFFVEYVYYFVFSLKYKIKFWMSLNDCSPLVFSENQIVYCHNASPFYKYRLNDFLYPTRIFLQSFYYSIFYFLNLKSNNYIIVQQESFKQMFCNRYKIDTKKILVSGCNSTYKLKQTFDFIKTNNKIIFIYPTSPLPHKNIEVVLNAAKILNECYNDNFEIVLTISGSENRYIKNVYSRYQHIPQIKWVGHLNINQLYNYYNVSTALIFSSKLETWGLPISEFKLFNKPIIICNEPYAIETANNYSKIKYFHPDDYLNLSKILASFINSEIIYFEECLFDNPNTDLHFENFDTLLDYVYK